MAARTPANPIFVALDTPSLNDATNLAAKLADHVGGLKLGLEFFSAHGPKGVQQIQKASELPIFLDLKFHDIPNTVASAVRAVCQLDVYMINVHACGGRAMMEAAVKAVDDTAHEFAVPKPLIIAVTVLTSMDAGDLNEAGVPGSPADQVLRLATLAKTSGLDGVVCSPHEAVALKRELGAGFKLVTPGVRPASAVANDQKRIMTPEEALTAGADFLVIGRPITGAADPAAAAARIAAEIRPLLTS